MKSHGGSGRIKPDLVIEGHERPIVTQSLSITDHKDKHGKIDKRAFYDEDGKLYLEIHATDHNYPKKHPFGEHGEHVHETKWQGERIKWEPGKELNEQLRKDNGDIL